MDITDFKQLPAIFSFCVAHDNLGNSMLNLIAHVLEMVTSC